ncbi:VWA domain-containing protein [Pontixanthobacter aestiaquae]|nr:VWA domain-containing protein [Pontixanthobacter aestiaquae]MDN3644810.1 VWA domain-containing protein [Pontixanthobacter aestiaquae]
MPAPPPPARTGAASGDSIVVTGSRVQGLVQEVPTAVSVIAAEQIEQEGGSKQNSRMTRGLRYVPPMVVPQDPGREKYDGEDVSPVKLVATDPLSTFSVDVDTGAYANTRRFLTQGQMPPRDAVRTEEMINYFRYDYAKPESRDVPFSVNTDVAVTPWNPETRLMRIGLRGYDIPQNERPAANLVFLLDVSGSMNSADKLPLVKSAMKGLANQLTERDTVSIVVYAGAAGLVLQPTNNPSEIRHAIDKLQAGGSTAGGAGIELAYRIAEDNMIKGGVNRVILATDGDFNVGVSDRDKLIELIEDKRKTGITLTTLGFGTGNYNEAMMEQIANHGNGNHAYIDSALEARKVLGSEMGSTIFTIAKDVKIQVEFNPSVISQYRLIGYENRALRNQDFDNDRVDAGDIGAGHQVTAIYEVVPAGAKGWVGTLRYGEPSAKMTADKEHLTEAAYVKLRYKMPDGDTSKLIDTIIPSSALRSASAPSGDFAFATAVAAFGQKLRKDDLLGDYDFDDIEKLAGNQRDFWRQEFKRLTDVAGSMDSQLGG